MMPAILTNKAQLEQTLWNSRVVVPKHSEKIVSIEEFRAGPTEEAVVYVPSWASEATFSRLAYYAMLIYACSAPLSIALSQIVVSAFIVYAVLQQMYGSPKRTFIPLFAVPMLTWIVIAFFSSLAGIDPPRAMLEFSKTAFYFLFPFAVFHGLSADYRDEQTLLLKLRSVFIALLIGQALASVHTVLEISFGDFLPLKPPGAVTESGQLVLSIAALVFLIFDTQRILQTPKKHSRLAHYLLACLVFCCGVFIAWADLLVPHGVSAALPIAIRIGFSLLFVIICAPLLSKQWRLSQRSLQWLTWQWGICGLMFATLLVNLKRGPWLGVFVELVVIGLFLSRRLIAVAVLGPCLLFFLLRPAHDRTMNFVDDFSVSGGRQEMWELGTNLAERYPLGLGLHNAVYMQKLDPGLPERHRHMHNNLLNIAVETGFLGMMIYVWWMYVTIKLGIVTWQALRKQPATASRRLAIAALILSCSLFGWQVAGVVEYNFGDGEIRLLSLFFIGILFTLASRAGVTWEGAGKLAYRNPEPLTH